MVNRAAAACEDLLRGRRTRGQNDPMTLSQLFVLFGELGEKHAFTLRSGTAFLGWVDDVREDAVQVLWAPGPLDYPAGDPDPTEWIPFASIDLNSLAFWDRNAGRWVDFPWL